MGHVLVPGGVGVHILTWVYVYIYIRGNICIYVCMYIMGCLSVSHLLLVKLDGTICFCSKMAMMAVLDALMKRLTRHARDSRVITPTFNVSVPIFLIMLAIPANSVYMLYSVYFCRSHREWFNWCLKQTIQHLFSLPEKLVELLPKDYAASFSSV